MRLKVPPVRVVRGRLDPHLGHPQPALTDPFSESGSPGHDVRSRVHVADKLGANHFRLTSCPEATVPLLATSAVAAEADVDDDIPPRGFLPFLRRVSPLVDVPLHQRAPSHSSSAGT